MDRETTIGKVARRSLIIQNISQLLYRMVRAARPDTTLELGTSLGISTAVSGKSRTSAQCLYFRRLCRGFQESQPEILIELSIKNIEIIRITLITV